MNRSKRVGRLSKSRAVVIAGLVPLFSSGLSWAGGPPNPTPSDISYNTAGGSNALIVNNGTNNTAFGALTLNKNNTGDYNSAFGFAALLNNNTGDYNSAFGFGTLGVNSAGANNSAFGAYALDYNDIGYSNSAFGWNALYSNTIGFSNTAIGSNALRSNGGGPENPFGSANLNTAVGDSALSSNLDGSGNTALGFVSLDNNIHGTLNTAIGYGANIDCGNFPCEQVVIQNSTALGSNALITASNSIVLGDNKISKIYAQVTSISPISDRRRKKDIKALDPDLGLDFIERLQPVSYRFNNGDETQRYGFIAQDLEQALPASLHDTIERSKPEHGLALIERENDKDRTYRVSYGELTAPLVKAIQQQQQEIEVMRHALAAVEHRVSALKAQNAALRHSITGQREQVTAAR